MKRITLLLLLCFNSYLTGAGMKEHTKKPTKIAIIEHLNSKWTTPITQAFQSSLNSTGEDLRFNWYIFNEGKKDQIKKDIVDWKPDVIFMPDEVIYRAFAKDLSVETNAHISTFFSAMLKEDILPIKNQSGVYNNYQSDQIFKMLNEMIPVKKLGIIGGPLGKDAIELIKKRLKGQVSIDSFIELTWFEYRDRLMKMESEYDAIWLLLPFGVMDGDKWVDHRKLLPIIKSYKKPTIGFGYIDSIHRTITVGMVPEKIGSNCASVVYSVIFKKNNPEIKDYHSYDMDINAEHAARFNLKITNDMAHFLRGTS